MKKSELRQIIREEIESGLEDKKYRAVIKALNGYITDNLVRIETWCAENDYGNYPGVSVLKRDDIASIIKFKIADGWSIEDVVEYMANVEQIDPSQAENKALRTMRMIKNKYK